jgi:hypothetical protein
MPDSENISLDLPIDAWVQEARPDPVKYRDRSATHIFLAAIGLTPALQETMVLKGGALMMLAFGSPRGTQDVDFTVTADPEPFASDLVAELNPALVRAAAQLGYLDLICRVQTLKRLPKRATFETATGAALRITIAHARRGTNEEQRLNSGQATRVVQVDLSFNEPVMRAAEARLERPSVTIRAYTLEDVIAEKLRALLQQPVRNRLRRQDVYDIAWLLDLHEPDSEKRKRIFDAMIAKGEARDLPLAIDSFDNPEVKRRAAVDWGSLELEVGELPDFERLFEVVRAFYRSLPW